MRVFSEKTYRKNLFILNNFPLSVEYRPGKSSIAHFAKGESCSLGCLSCSNPKCMKFAVDEIKCMEVQNFSNDNSLNVCPVNALAWDEEKEIPKIDNSKCIDCGICMRRCPVGALYFDGEVKVNSTPSAQQRMVTATESNILIQNEQLESLENIKRTGILIMESNDIFNTIYDKLSNLKSQFHNIVGRNLLISLGCYSAMRRIGDVYTRMDAVYSSADGSFGAVEIEFGKETLDASRGILDDIAVLFTRYGIGKDENIPLVICLSLPNVRQGYWQVVKDIKNVEEINIGTLTIGALFLLNWNGCLLMPDDVTYYLDYDNMNLRNVIAWQIGREPKISEKHLGILEPVK